jgi:uncharacterized damage-inducible protein DinB
MTRKDPRIRLLLEILDEAFDRKGWHGTTLRGALRGVTPRQARWRPGPRRHCIWDLVLHTAYWKYAVRRRLERGGGAAFPRAPSNWPKVPAKPDLRAWRADVALLEAEHAALRALVARLPARALDAPSAKGAWRQREQIHGVAAHDLYHTGQIQLLKRLMP